MLTSFAEHAAGVLFGQPERSRVTRASTIFCALFGMRLGTNHLGALHQKYNTPAPSCDAAVYIAGRALLHVMAGLSDRRFMHSGMFALLRGRAGGGAAAPAGVMCTSLD